MPETSQLITSMEPDSVHNNHTTIKIKGMEREFYEAAVEGVIAKFSEKSPGEIKSILTINKNTILHIHLTCCMVSLDFVSNILENCRALLKEVNSKHETILHIAARYGHLEIVKIIIGCANNDAPGEVGTKETLIKATNDKNDTALHEAVRYNHKEVVKLLIEEDLNVGENNDGETPLYIAAERGCNEIIHTILEKSNSPNHKGPNGRTALHAAVVHFDKLGTSNRDILKELVSKIPSAMEEADENGWLPLHLAALNSNSELVGVLLTHRRNTAYMRDNKGRTALHFAAYCGNFDVIQKIILDCPDCSELVDHKGRNALHYAIRLNKRGYITSWRAETEQQLRNMYNEKDNDGNTPLHLLAHFAPAWRKNQFHKLLVESTGVDTMAFNKNNQTALDVAYDVVPSTSQDKNFFLRKLQHKIGARFGGRVLKKKKQQKRHGSKEIQEQKQENKEIEENFLVRKLRRVRETLFVVATLIATVTFAAGFTVPGGTIQDGQNKGSPILMHNAAFKAFVITNSLSFVLSASAVLLQIFSSFAEGVEDITKIDLVALVLTMLGMVFMIVAFGTGKYAILGASIALAVFILLIALSFFSTFYLPYSLIREKVKSQEEELPFFEPEASFLGGRDMQLLDIV